jgi:hypothetical protein
MKKKLNIILSFLLLLGVWSCNEEKWLTEEPYSFYAPENSYSTVPQLKLSLNYLYNELRTFFWNINGDNAVFMHLGDIAYGGTDFPNGKFNNTRTWLVPTAGMASTVWDRAYRCIQNANTIINRLENSAAGADDKAFIEGEALFFRAFWYNYLAIMYGDVPVYTEEITSAKTDFVRTPRKDVYTQARMDLERAVTLLLDIDKVDDGRINKQAAQHLLAEVYISLEDYAKAIETASAVINHPQMSLMTSRFGTRANEPGDPYWDLFQYNNQNRKSSGNKESILVLQYEHRNSGSPTGYNFLRQGFPFYMDIRVYNMADQANPEVVTPTVTATEGLFPISLGGARGIGVIHPSDYFLYDIWGTDGTNDYRNSPYIIVRDFKISNQQAAGYGEWYVADGHADLLKQRNPDLYNAYMLRNFYPFIMKFGRTDNALPDDVLAKNSDGSFRLNGLGERVFIYTSMTDPSANSSLKDEYLFRLGGTYLLRAEAYIKSNQLTLAMNDINALRNRANATPAELSQINLDYLMDEQMRERYFEDYRIMTLLRMGKFVERTRKHNPMGHNVDDHHNLFPIPFSEIERNRDVKWENNPGY